MKTAYAMIAVLALCLGLSGSVNAGGDAFGGSPEVRITQEVQNYMALSDFVPGHIPAGAAVATDDTAPAVCAPAPADWASYDLAQIAADPDVIYWVGNAPIEWTGYTMAFGPDEADGTTPFDIIDTNGCVVYQGYWGTDLAKAAIDGVATPGLRVGQTNQ